MYIVEWNDHEGNLHQQTFDNRADAELEAAYLEEKIRLCENTSRLTMAPGGSGPKQGQPPLSWETPDAMSAPAYNPRRPKACDRLGWEKPAHSHFALRLEKAQRWKLLVRCFEGISLES